MYHIKDSLTAPCFCTLHPMEWTCMDLQYLMPQVFCSRNTHQPGNQVGFPKHRCQSQFDASEILHVWKVAGLPGGKVARLRNLDVL